MAETKPFFIQQKEIDFFDAVNEELIDNILGQYVDVYKVSVEDTESNLYGESTTKYYNTGFRVNCLISFEEPTVEQNDLGPDVMANLELYFHRTTLNEANFYPEMGDIVDWNDFYWEIGSVTEPQLVAGHPGYKHSIKAVAGRARLSSLQIEERSR